MGVAREPFLGLAREPFMGRTQRALQKGQYLGELSGREGFCISPKSRGTITLKSTNVHDHPNIDPQFLSHPDDVIALVKGIKVALVVGNTSAFINNFGTKFYDKPLPGCTGEIHGSDSYWVYVHHMSTTFCHLTGDCKMAPASDPHSVVDHTLRVRGVGGLKVVDASIMTFITTANTNAPTIMITEKGIEKTRQVPRPYVG
nr:glucose dehydrogenase [FAD, quinone]-like [Cherax quadricarinatus]